MKQMTFADAEYAGKRKQMRVIPASTIVPWRNDWPRSLR